MKEEGASLVEAAIVLPIIALLVYGIIEFGYVLAGYITLRNASAVAARVGILENPAASPADICAAASNAIQPLLDPTRLNCNPLTDVIIDTGFTPRKVTVNISYNMPSIVNYAPIHSGNWMLTASTTMR